METSAVLRHPVTILLTDFTNPDNLTFPVASSVNKGFFIIKRFENEKVIGQIVRKSDQNGYRVSKNDKSCHICSMRLKEAFS